MNGLIVPEKPAKQGISEYDNPNLYCQNIPNNYGLPDNYRVGLFCVQKTNNTVVTAELRQKIRHKTMYLLCCSMIKSYINSNNIVNEDPLLHYLYMIKPVKQTYNYLYISVLCAKRTRKDK